MPDDTLHARLSDELRARIEAGELKPGDALPSEAALGKESGYSRITVRKALQTLEQEGLVAAQVGRGRVVRSRRNVIYRPQAETEPRRSATMDRFTASLTEEGRAPTQTIEIAVEPARGIIAERYRVPDGTPMAVRKRVRGVDGEPFSINDTYYLHSLAADTPIMYPDDIPQGSNSIIRDKVGAEVTTVDEFYVRMPTPDEIRRLKLNPGTPVAVHYATGYTADEKIVRVEYFVIPGDRHVIVYERHHAESGSP